MPAVEPGKIRNVAVVGHRGTGKTSLVEAMLFQAGATNRLGTIHGRATRGARGEGEARPLQSPPAPRVVEGALFFVSGVMGVEVQTSRLWQRAADADLSRVVFVNMLDRERADFFRVLGALREQLSEHCVAVHLPIGSEHELTGIVDLLHMCFYMSPE